MGDVIVIGGGVIGLTCAYELAGRGVDVMIVERGQPGREASWAGAGILPPGYPGDPQHPLARLSAATHPRWPALSEELRELTGVDNGFRMSGGLCFTPDADQESLQAEIDGWKTAGITPQPLTAEQIHELEPAVGSSVGPGYRLADTWQIRNPRHLKALLSACRQRGVAIRSGLPAVKIERQDDRITAVQTPEGRLTAGAYLVTSGPWSQQLLEEISPLRPIEPVRGQMILLSTPAPPVQHVIECGPRYIVPRPDGRTLVGATEEWVGFEKRNTPSALRSLTAFAIRMVPELAEARFEQTWSGLRPHPVDGIPLIGRVGELENLFVAAGHFRAGLHLSPITGRLIGQLMTGAQTDLPLGSFEPASSSAID